MPRFLFGKKIYKRYKRLKSRSTGKLLTIQELPNLECQQDNIPESLLPHMTPSFVFIQSQNQLNFSRFSSASKSFTSSQEIERSRSLSLTFSECIKSEVQSDKYQSTEIYIKTSQMSRNHLRQNHSMTDDAVQAQKESVQIPTQIQEISSHSSHRLHQEESVSGSVSGSIPTGIIDFDISYKVDFKMQEENDNFMKDFIQKTFAQVIKDVFDSSEVRGKMEFKLSVLRRRIQEAKRLKKWNQKRMKMCERIY